MNETREKAEELKTNDKDDLKDLKKFGYAVIYIVLIFVLFFKMYILNP